MTELLRVKDLYAGYADSVVLQGINFSVHQGEVICLLGANGAGKTSTMGALTGLVDAFGGEISYDGEDLLGLAPHERVKRGIALSPEGRKVFPNLTVEENLMLGSFNVNARSHRKQSLEEVYSLFPKLAERYRQSAGLMSGGEQQMLALGRALMSKPRLLLLDEPSLGLAPKIVQLVFEAIRKISATNITILLVEQNTHAALGVATRGYLMSAGRIVHEGTAAELKKSDLVRDAFIGGRKRSRQLAEGTYA